MAQPYEIVIEMAQDDLVTLKSQGAVLYAFKAVKTAQGGGAPLVWFHTTDYLNFTFVRWEEEYQAYISSVEIVANAVVTKNSAMPIELGQTVNVDDAGAFSWGSGGTTGAVSIMNNGGKAWTTGIAQMVNGTVNPMCALPVYPHMLDIVTPIEKVLLVFALLMVDTGTVVYKTYSGGLVVDLTGAEKRSVTYSVNKGWDAQDAPWAKLVEPGADLLAVLIEHELF